MKRLACAAVENVANVARLQARRESGGLLTDLPVPGNYRPAHDEMARPVKDNEGKPNWGVAQRSSRNMGYNDPKLPRNWFEDDVSSRRPASSSNSNDKNTSTNTNSSNSTTQPQAKTNARPPHMELRHLNNLIEKGALEKEVKTTARRVASVVVPDHEREKTLQSLSKAYPQIAETMWLPHMSKDTLSKPKPFTLVMSGYAAAGNLSGVQRLWMAMKQRGVQENLVTYNVVLNCFANMRDEEKALSLLSTMEADGITADLVSYNTAIRACKRMDKALGLLRHLKSEGFTPDAYTLESLLVVCLANDDLETAELILADFTAKSVTPNGGGYLNLMKIYQKAGKNIEALQLYNKALSLPRGKTVRGIGQIVVDICKEHVTQASGPYFSLLSYLESNNRVDPTTRTKLNSILRDVQKDVPSDTPASDA